MKNYTEAVYSIVLWLFVIGAVIFIAFAGVFAYDILTDSSSPYRWIDVLASGLTAVLSMGAAALTRIVRRIHNTLIDR
jgi:steroid 5-alpha reductase family enzyme